MHREIVIACLPYLGVMALSVGCAWLLVRMAGGRLQLAQLRRLHRDQLGGVQSLSFVLTLPLLMIVLMFIVQLSQITIAKVVVEYAAYSAARSAMVWIPASLGNADEGENQIGMRRMVGMEGGADAAWTVYEIDAGGQKYEKIRHAAAMACMPIAPSRDSPGGGNQAGAAVAAIQSAYRAISPASAGNPRIAARLQNKLAYALDHTHIKIEIRHKEDRVELPLAHYEVLPAPWEYAPNEIGWQDQVTVTVDHDFALLPGPARILARRADARPGTSAEDSPGSDQTARMIEKKRGIYTYPLTATARLSNEGEKSVLSYVQWLSGGVPSNPPPSDYDGEEDGIGPLYHQSPPEIAPADDGPRDEEP